MVRGLTVLRWGGELGQCTAGTFRIGEAVKRVCIRAAWLNALEHTEIDETAERAVGAWLDPFLLEGRRGVFEAGSDAADQLGRLVGGSHHGVVAIHVRDAIDGHARGMFCTRSAQGLCRRVHALLLAQPSRQLSTHRCHQCFLPVFHKRQHDQKGLQ